MAARPWEANQGATATAAADQLAEGLQFEVFGREAATMRASMEAADLQTTTEETVQWTIAAPSTALPVAVAPVLASKLAVAQPVQPGGVVRLAAVQSDRASYRT